MSLAVPGPAGLCRVVLTGSECTGKTTLARELAARFACAWVPEYVRGYVDALGRELHYADVEPIARGQIEATDAAARASRRLLVQDTDLVSTIVYSRHYYGDCPAWIEAAARERLAQLYLLLHPDVPWLPDPQRDRGDRREELHALFAAALERLGARVIDVRGPWSERSHTAAAAVEALLS